MAKEASKKENVFATIIATGCATVLSYLIMKEIGFVSTSENTEPFLIQVLLFLGICISINYVLLRFFNWLYS